jgi:hypothetical protein
MAGASLAAVEGGALQLLRAGGDVRVTPPDGVSGVIRHVTTRAGVGTAYVRDSDGADVVVEVTAAVVRRGAGGEATHPALSPAGDPRAVGADLRLVPAGTTAPHRPGLSAGRARVLPAPPRRRHDRGGVCPADARRARDKLRAPLAISGADRRPSSHTLHGRAIAGRGADAGLTPHDAIELSASRVASADGSRLQLWRWTLARGAAGATLPEMYLAGFEAGTRVWNVRAGVTGAWRLAIEAADGTLHDVGWGP